MKVETVNVKDGGGYKVINKSDMTDDDKVLTDAEMKKILAKLKGSEDSE